MPPAAGDSLRWPVVPDAAPSRPLPVIAGRSLTKRFGDFVAVDAIDFEVRQGEFFGFLGPNGAGKTSTMRMIGCVSPVSGGELSVLGLDPRTDGPAIRARLGVVPQEDTLDIDLTVHDLYRDGFPHALFGELREQHPVWRHRRATLKRAPDGIEFWVVLGHPELQTLARDWRTFSSLDGASISPTGDEQRGHTLVSADPPNHSRMRKLISSGFTPRPRSTAIRIRSPTPSRSSTSNGLRSSTPCSR